MKMACWWLRICETCRHFGGEWRDCRRYQVCQSRAVFRQCTACEFHEYPLKKKAKK